MMDVKVLRTSGRSQRTRRNRKKSRTLEELRMLAKDKKGTWAKSWKESSKRESDVIVLAEDVAAMEKDDEHTRAIIRRSLRQLRKIREEEEEEEEPAKELLEAVQDRKQQLEDELWKEVDDYIFSWEPEKKRSRTLNAKIWQLVQSSNTKSENLEHAFNEIVAKVQDLGWEGGKRLSRCWVEKEEEESL